MATGSVTKKEYAAPAVDRTLDILEFLAEHPEPYGIAELARTLSISNNSIFRILRRLTDRGYTELDEESGGYQLSTRFFTLGMKLHARFDLRRRARKELEGLCRATGETSQLQIPNGDRMLVLDSALPDQDFFLQVVPGSRVHSHGNAFGKVVLAFLDEEGVSSLLPKRLPALTKNTKITRKALNAELIEVRKATLAYDRDEYIDGVTCIGAPIFDSANDVIAGVGIAGLTTRIQDRLTPLSDEVCKAGERISRAMGYEAPYRGQQR
ncbi:MAG: IclR family transcriptional regulator [Planctomycetota bacterium]|jgi:IclR family acetate operon transcriptional repressor